LLARLSGSIGPVQKLIDQSGVKMTPGTFLFASGSAALVGFLVVQSTLGQPVFALLVAGGLACLPYLWLHNRRAARLWKFEEQFPESVDLISRALKAGHTVPTGLSIV